MSVVRTDLFPSVADWFGEAPSLPLCDRQALIEAWTRAAEPFGLNIMLEVGLLPFRETLMLVRKIS